MEHYPLIRETQALAYNKPFLHTCDVLLSVGGVRCTSKVSNVDFFLPEVRQVP